MKEVTIYCDGACSYNPGPGGWACVLDYKGNKKEISGYNPDTTNNRMELTAAMKGLMALKERCRVHVYTDSAYIHNAFDKGWIVSWQRNGWKTAAKKPVENQDLWKEILNQTKSHIVKWHKVKGHSDDALNNRCDELARAEIKKHKAEGTNNHEVTE
ncbi:MAG: ribonuclease HI [Christensenellaceae bacterium]